MHGMPSPHARLGKAGTLVALVAVVALTASGCGKSAGVTDPPLVTGEPPTEQVPVIVDTDVDVSDVAALAVLLRDPGLDVRAVTIVPTGTGVTNCASGRRIVQYILEEFGSTTIPFACGREDRGADGQHFPDEWRLNADAGWGMAMPPRPQTEIPEDAVTLLRRAIDGSPSAPTIVALGPWTNLEDIITVDPTIADRIAGIHAMGGAVDVPGNVIVGDINAENGLEWNLAADPSAVSAVFTTSAPITLVPLDATNDVPVLQDLSDRLASDRAAAGADLVYELLQRVPTRTTGEGQSLWDELAALTLTNPDLATWEDANLIADNAGRVTRLEAGRTVRIATAADRGAVETALLDALRVGPARATPFKLAGKLTVRWDGSTCTFDMSGGLTPGIAALTYENSTGDPAGVQIVGVREPHTWADVEALLPTLDLTTEQTAQPPDWVIDAGQAVDDKGTGVPVKTTARLEAGTYGPVCLTGTWPDIEFHPGQPFVVAAP